MLRFFRREFDCILIDTPPMLHIADARVLGRLADAVVLVLRAGKTTLDTALTARQRFSEDGTMILGTILNDWDPRAFGHGKDYYSGYKNYYANAKDS
ncbi:MAG: lipopolysaccharide biosynthesis protein, partial [Bryobacteraceae bacterium]